MKPGPKPRGDHALTDAERSAAYRARRKAAGVAGKPAVVVRYRRPADRRTRPQRWRDAVTALLDCLDDYQAWQDALPDGSTSIMASHLADVLALRGLVEELDAAELPKGFGRD